VLPERPGAWPEGFAAAPRDRDAALALAHLQSVVPRDLRALAVREGSASRCLAALAGGRLGSAADASRALAVRPTDVRRALSAAGAREAVPGDEGYPDVLLDLADPPVCLFVRGRRLDGWFPHHASPVAAAAVVGARKPTSYGLEIAGVLGAGLGAAGAVVVSGAALGIDAAAHRGALRVGGGTIAVLGSGIDRAYPRRHRGLLAEIERNGAVVSEYPPGFHPLPRRFPARNRIVAALARAVVVVEGAPGSGSLITAGFGLDLGREVLAVPGPVTSPLSVAPHDLIREGAGLVRGVEDVLQAVCLAPGGGGEDGLPQDLTDQELLVLRHLSAPAPAEVVARTAGLDRSGTLACLVGLELRGLVRSVGGRFERTARWMVGEAGASSPAS
jgi:DNA processing protein